MKFTIIGTAAGVLVLATCADVSAFGRGARVGVAGPQGSFQAGGGTRVGPAGAATGGYRGGTYVAPGGTTIQRGSAGAVGVGPYGGVRAGGVSGTKITAPGGQSYTHVQGGAAGVGPLGGAAVRGGSVTGVSGVNGSAVVGHRGGVAVGPYGGVGVAGTRVAVGHATGYVSPYALRASAVTVRTATTYPFFNTTWYRAHGAAWIAPRYVVGGTPWVWPAWGTLATFIGVSAPPIAYDYGSSVVFTDDSVYVNGDPVGTATEYAAQALATADVGRTVKPAESDDWQPLGVFGLVQGDEKVANNIFQLAVNKDGVIRGTYYDAIADTTLQVYGSVDKTTQRAAWSIGEKKDIVFEAGINNLTQNEATLLVHYGKDRTQQMMLVRLEEPGK